jgi:hypothetical protein
MATFSLNRANIPFHEMKFPISHPIVIIRSCINMCCSELSSTRVPMGRWGYSFCLNLHEISIPNTLSSERGCAVQGMESVARIFRTPLSLERAPQEQACAVARLSRVRESMGKIRCAYFSHTLLSSERPWREQANGPAIRYTLIL